MDKPDIAMQKVQYEQPVIKAGSNIADVDDVINVLNVLENSDKELNFFDKPEATDYLKAVGLISEPQPNQFKVTNLQGVRDLNDHLSNFMENLIEKASKPNVIFNSAHVEK